MRDRHHAVHVLEGRERIAPKSVRDRVADGGRAVHAGNHADIVAGAGLTVRARVAEEGIGAGSRRGVPGRCGCLRLAVMQRRHAEIVHMHVFACRDVPQRDADGLPILGDTLASRDIAHGELVPGRDGRADPQRPAVQFQARIGFQRPHGDRHVVVVVQRDEIAILHDASTPLPDEDSPCSASICLKRGCAVGKDRDSASSTSGKTRRSTFCR